MKRITILSTTLVLLGALACGTPAAHRTPATTARTTDDRAADRAELLRLHERQRWAHLNKRADSLVAEQADSMFSVSRGRVSVSGRAAVQAMFQRYLDSATFQAWDDIVPPRIRISPDGQMAYVIVEKRVHLTEPGPNGAPTTERVRYAWLSVYEKQGGRWRHTAIASTDRPDAP